MARSRADRLATIEEELGAHHEASQRLVAEARSMLLGCLVQPKALGPWYVVTSVHNSLGHLFLIGNRYSRATRSAGTRNYTIGAVVLCHKILPAGTDPWKDTK